MADAKNREESEILSEGFDVSSQVLKVAHHGDRGSSNLNFLEAVNPSIGIISCGAGNKYGQPHDITLQKLTDLGITIYITDTTGDIIVQSDGNSYSVTLGNPFVYNKTKTN